MKTPVRSGFILLLLFLMMSPVNGRPAPVMEGNIDDVAKVVLSYFPKVDGKVVSIDEESLEIDMGREKGLSEGVLLTIYREKEPFYHPVTGVALGRFEETVATVEATRVEQGRLRARIIRSTRPVSTGDLARLSKVKIPIAVTTAPSEGEDILMAELAASLSETGRFRVDPLPPQATVKEAADRRNLYLIRVSASKKEDQFVMGLQIQNTETGAVLSEMEARIHPSGESDLILEQLQYRLLERRGLHQR